MVIKTKSYGISGIEVFPVEIEIDCSNGLPSITVVGLPDTAIKESKERIRAAIKNSNFNFPLGRVTISLAPADVKKEGNFFDLPIALGIISSLGYISQDALQKFIIIGELGLDGKLRPIRGTLAIASELPKGSKLIVPEENKKEAAIIEHIEVFGARSLHEAIEIISGEKQPYKINISSLLSQQINNLPDFSEVKGQQLAKRAMEISAAGGHNIIMIGPPGAGKTMLAKRMPSILPPLSLQEAIETTKIHSIAGLLKQPLITLAPFRSPHHTTSPAAIIGGGNPPSPGEISLAHNGVLFLDELPEFRRDVIEALRQPLEEGTIRISRAGATSRFPAKFILVCAMNPCPCGFYGSTRKTCSCSPYQIQRYLKKISGPLMDRIDIQLQISDTPIEQLHQNTNGETSRTIRQRVISARSRQIQRQGKLNSHLSNKELSRFCPLTKPVRQLLTTASENLKLSARAYHKVIKVARTISDLSGEETISQDSILEALTYRISTLL